MLVSIAAIAISMWFTITESRKNRSVYIEDRKGKPKFSTFLINTIWENSGKKTTVPRLRFQVENIGMNEFEIIKLRILIYNIDSWQTDIEFISSIKKTIPTFDLLPPFDEDFLEYSWFLNRTFQPRDKAETDIEIRKNMDIEIYCEYKSMDETFNSTTKLRT